jgi:hypothetical protein
MNLIPIMFLGGSRKNFLLCFKLCYLEIGVEKGSLGASKRKKTQHLIFQSFWSKMFYS